MTYTYRYPLFQTVLTVDLVNNNCVKVNNIVFYRLLTAYTPCIVHRRVWTLVPMYVADKICSLEIQNTQAIPIKIYIITIIITTPYWKIIGFYICFFMLKNKNIFINTCLLTRIKFHDSCHIIKP